MSHLDPAVSTAIPEWRDIGPTYIALGIPQGVIADRATGEIAGAVRRGGELVSLDSVEYQLWRILLTPLTPGDTSEVALKHHWGDVEPTIARLREMGLLAQVEPGKPLDGILAALRPLPLGFGLGNFDGDPMRFEIQNAALSLPSPVSLDVVAVLFWWEFDGTKSLGDVVSHVATAIPELSLDTAESLATSLIYGLMTCRLLYLDSRAR
jgi:hypothetical protein